LQNRTALHNVGIPFAASTFSVTADAVLQAHGCAIVLLAIFSWFVLWFTEGFLHVVPHGAAGRDLHPT